DLDRAAEPHGYRGHDFVAREFLFDIVAQRVAQGRHEHLLGVSAKLAHIPEKWVPVFRWRICANEQALSARQQSAHHAAKPEDPMSVTVGSGDYTYRVEEQWAKLPTGWEFGDVGAVGVDRQDRVYVFNRGEHPMCVFDRDGNFLKSWGEGVFRRAHGVHMGPDDTIYCTDDGDHTVRKCTLDGKILLEIGIPGRPSGFMSGAPFN